jgi:hypothetical protein
MGDKLLTTPNPETDDDQRLFDKLGMRLLAKPASEKNIDESSLAAESADAAK